MNAVAWMALFPIMLTMIVSILALSKVRDISSALAEGRAELAIVNARLTAVERAAEIAMVNLRISAVERASAESRSREIATRTPPPESGGPKP
jgi:hypothetical protein